MTREELKDRALDMLQQYVGDMGELQDFREYADRAYMMEPVDIDGETLGTEAGRSTVKASDVADTVEWIMPTMMRIFYGGSKVCELSPVGKEDELKAKLMEEKVNFDFMRQNKGFLILHDFFKDAMLSKMAVVKYWWEEKTEKKKQSFENLTIPEYEALLDDPNFEATKVDEVIEQFDEIETATYTVEGYRSTKHSRPVAEVIPPEECIFDVSERELTEESFFAHKKLVHKNYLKSKYNVKEADITSETQTFDVFEDKLVQERFKDLGGKNWLKDWNKPDFYYIYECFMPDYDKNGAPVPKKVTVFGNEVIDVEDNTYKKPPFCTISAIRKPYRMVGLSLSELVMEIQKLHTALLRAALDNAYYQNNGVQVVNPYRINMDDVLDHNHPGAKWRTLYDVDPKTVASPMPVNPLPRQFYDLMERVEVMKENRTGVTKYNQGLDSKSLNKTATGISQIMSASQQRMELIARIFSETGVKDLFQAFVDMNLEFFDSETSIRVNEEWQTITPESIDGKYDVIVDVGVGTGTNEVKISQMMNMLNVSVPAVQMGVVSKENYYNMLAQIWELMGYKNTDKFVSRPTNELPPEIVNAMMGLLSQEGVDVNALVQAAAKTVQGGQGQPQAGGQAPPGAQPR